MLMAKRIDEIVTSHRRQHDEVVEEVTYEGRKRTTAYRVATQTPLDRYFVRKQINQRQWQAGNELYIDWYEAGYESKVVIDLTKPRVDEGRRSRLAESKARRQARLARAHAVVGSIAWPEVCRVCCEQKPAGSKASMEILRRGLTVLAAHYGY